MRRKLPRRMDLARGKRLHLIDARMSRPARPGRAGRFGGFGPESPEERTAAASFADACPGDWTTGASGDGVVNRLARSVFNAELSAREREWRLPRAALPARESG